MYSHRRRYLTLREAPHSFVSEVVKGNVSVHSHWITENCTPGMLGRKFHVSVAGCTNGAHQTYVNDLKGMGQIEVISPEQSDYLVLFCPIASRVGTDIGEAMDKISGGKPIVLVVMHHTYDKDHFVPESRRLVENPDVIVTVDVLFHESKMLICNRNDTAWFQVKDVLGVSPGPVSSWLYWTGVLQSVVRWCGFLNSCVKLWSWIAPVLNWRIIGGIVVVVVVVIIVSVAVHYTQKKEDLRGLLFQ